MKKAILCISFDTELAWGRHDLPYYKKFLWRARSEREIIKRLLSLFEKYSIPATWAVVGHLFLASCSPEKKVKHPEITRPTYRWLEKDWFSPDPAASVTNNPEWYGPDIVRLIKRFPLQEIGSHSFSHIIFGDPGCNKQCAEDELALCVALAKKMKIRLVSFVFPRNSVGHLILLKKYGFSSFRGENPRYSTPFIGSTLRTGEYFFSIPPAVFVPKQVKGMVNIPESLYFPSARGIRKYLPDVFRLKKIKQGIDQAIRQEAVFHLWTHPTDFADDTERLLRVFEQVLQYAYLKREEGVLSTMTMEQIAKEQPSL